MNVQLEVLNKLSFVSVDHRHCPLGYESGREEATGSLGEGDNIGCTRTGAVGNRFLGPHPLRWGRCRPWEAKSKG